MLNFELIFYESQPTYAYKRHAYKKENVPCFGSFCDKVTDIKCIN